MKKYASLFVLAICFSLNSGFAQQEETVKVETAIDKPSDEVSSAEESKEATPPSFSHANQDDCGCDKGKKK